MAGMNKVMFCRLNIFLQNLLYPTSPKSAPLNLPNLSAAKISTLYFNPCCIGRFRGGHENMHTKKQRRSRGNLADKKNKSLSSNKLWHEDSGLMYYLCRLILPFVITIAFLLH
jgi:hypothetical protein